jgi:hypothetical protein
MAKRILVLAIVMVGAVAVSPSIAQENDQSVPACELSGGYAFVRDFDLSENLPAGGYFSATANLSRWFGLVGDVSLSRRTFDEGNTVNITGTVVSAGVGPRAFRKLNRFVPYAQVLAGATYTRAELRSEVMDVDADETFFSVQPGAGVLMYFNSRVGAQVSFDYRWVDPAADDGEDWGEFRFVTGVVVGFGSR